MVRKGWYQMLNLFKKNEKVVFHQPYRPSWEESARQWEKNHIAHKKLADSVKKELGTNTLPRV